MIFRPNKLAFTLGLFLMAAMPAVAADTKSAWKATCDIVFSGTSTLHGFSGVVKSQPFVVSVVLDEAGRPKTIHGTAIVKAAEMDTGDKKRDKKMRESMKVTEFPLIIGSVSGLPFADTLGKGVDGPVALPFTLELLGKKHAVEAAVTAWKRKGNAAQFETIFPLSLKKCGIVVPPVMKFIKVGDEVTVKTTVRLNRVK